MLDSHLDLIPLESRLMDGLQHSMWVGLSHSAVTLKIPGGSGGFNPTLSSTGRMRCTLRRLVTELGVEASVDFRGEESDEEMLSCYQQCDIFALPNRTVDGDFEGFGMVLLEAQACGKPVIAGRSGGTGEAIQEGQTALRVNCQSSQDLEGSLSLLMDSQQFRESMGQSGRRWVSSEFGWESLTKRATGIFEDIQFSGA